MDFNINGTLYLVKDEKLTENKHYEILLNWIVFKEQPQSDEEISKIKKHADLFIKQEIEGLHYTNSTKSTKTKEFNIPEIYLRYKLLLDNIVEI
jgi:hypothetical protein